MPRREATIGPDSEEESMSDRDGIVEGRAELAGWRRGRPDNAFAADSFASRVLRRHLGERFTGEQERLLELGAAVARPLEELVAESSRDEHLPVLRRFDGIGRRTEEVVFHSAYHETGRAYWASEVLTVLGEPGNETRAGARAYLLGQLGEGGHLCPVACTAGCIKLLQAAGSEEQRRRYLPRLLDPDYERRLHASQFVTEVQGGSDVGANDCRAIPDTERPGWFRVSGEKWFCSVADAGVFVVSARPDGAPEGTRGLGLFLMPRTVDGEPNGFRLRRLKTKLGTRSMATGEIELEGALAEPVGPLGDGFRNLVGIVLDTSRVFNALGCAGLMRRAFVEAQVFAAHRTAFGRPILDFPSTRRLLAGMRVRAEAALLSTFRILALSDRLALGAGDEAAAAARRVAVMVNKYWTAVAATRTARDGIEVLGGNGTIEEFSPLPRLYRDAMVLESWEGTHNTLCAQVLRDFARRRLHVSFLDLLEEELGSLRQQRLADRVRAAALLLEGARRRVDRLLGDGEEYAGAHVRQVVDLLARVTDLVAFLQQAEWELGVGEDGSTLASLELYRLVEVEGADPMETPRIGALVDTLSTSL